MMVVVMLLGRVRELVLVLLLLLVMLLLSLVLFSLSSLLMNP